MKRLELPELGRVAPAFAEQVERLGPLQCDERGLVGHVAKLAVVLRRAREDAHHLLVVRRVADDEPPVLGGAIHDEIVEDGAAVVAGARVERLPIRQLLRVVRDEVVHDLRGVLAAHLELAHVRDVEDPRRRTHGGVLRDDARVLNGHLEPCERHEPSAGFLVLLVQRRMADGFSHAAELTSMPRLV